MLVPFIIDPVSLEPDSAWTAAQVNIFHKSLLDVWQRVGLLTHDGDSFADSRLNEAVQKLPQKLRPLWHEMLKRVPSRRCGIRWDGRVTRDNISRLTGITSLALVDDACAEVDFGFDEDQLSKVIEGERAIEVCRFISAAQARAFEKALNQSGMHIEARDRYDDIWALRFKELAAAGIKRVTIVDRYAIVQHMNCPQRHLSGIERFLRLLDRDADGPRYVSLFSAWTDDVRRDHLAAVKDDFANVVGRLPKHKIKLLKISMVSKSAFGRVSHDRFVRFENYVWDIGVGLKVFQGACAEERSSAAFKTGDGIIHGYKQVEMDLDGDAGTKHVEIPG